MGTIVITQEQSAREARREEFGVFLQNPRFFNYHLTGDVSQVAHKKTSEDCAGRYKKTKRWLTKKPAADFVPKVVFYLTFYCMCVCTCVNPSP